MRVLWGDVAVVKDAKAGATWCGDESGFEIRDDRGHWVTVAPPGSKEMVLHPCAGGEPRLFEDDDLKAA